MQSSADGGHNVILCRRESQCNPLQKGATMQSSVKGSYIVFVIGLIGQVSGSSSVEGIHNVILCRRESQCYLLCRGTAMYSLLLAEMNHNVIPCRRKSQCNPLQKGITMYALLEGDRNVILCRRESQCIWQVILYLLQEGVTMYVFFQKGITM